ncbi:hypothetical protein E4U41_003589 [Claviceps citrina]|nr:hypothetical protein E4U41_003589 [Claviceps citrina]
MENQFLSVNTWRGHVLVSASLLRPSTEEAGRADPTCSSIQRTSLMRRHDMQTSTSLPPVPDFWKHNHRGQVEAVMANAKPSRHDRDPDSSAHDSPVYNSSETSDDRSPLSSCWTPRSCGSNLTSPTNWEDPTTITSPCGTATDSWPNHSMPSPVQHRCGCQQVPFDAAGFSHSLSPPSSEEDEQSPKRRRLSLGTPSTQRLYEARGGLWPC